MARKARIQFEGALYHIFNRGIDRRDLFWDDRDFYFFLDSLALGVERFHVEIHAYCLMTNHFHLLLGTPLGNVSRFMQGVQTRYGGYFNLRHRRSGYVYQGPYGAKLVEGDEYLLALSRYIHLNAVRLKKNEDRPVEALVDDLRAYRWSSYREYIRTAKRKEWMTYGAVEAHVEDVMSRRRGAYRMYVELGLVERDEEFESLMKKAAGIIATQEFIHSVRDRMGLEASDENVAFRSVKRPVQADRVLEMVCKGLGMDREELARRRGSAWARGVAAEMLCVYAGLTHVEAGRHLGMGTSGAVSIRRKHFAELRSKDKKLNKQATLIERELDMEMG